MQPRIEFIDHPNIPKTSNAPQTAISKAVCYKTKNEQLKKRLFIFCMLPPTVFMQFYQLFFCTITLFAVSVKSRLEECDESVD